MFARRIAALSVAAMFLAVGLIAGLPTVATSERSPFVGLWSSVDIDGSNQVLRIVPGEHGQYRFSYFDDRTLASGPCEGAPALVYGGAVADGNKLTGRFPFLCLTEPPRLAFPFAITLTLTYDPDTDTLEWEFGIWTRGKDSIEP